MMEYDNDVPVPTKDILLGVLNDEDSAIRALLQYYEPYITVAASVPVYNSLGLREGVFISDDLKQETALRILRSLPMLRRKLRQRGSSKKSYVIVIG